MAASADAPRRRRPPPAPNGVGIDASGNPVVDPTENVLALTDAATRRQDDLRDASEKYIKSEVDHAKELSMLRSSQLTSISELRAEYTKQLAEAEAKRIDAIRAVDVNAVAVASERQAAAANVLATQVAQSADALRTLVSTTAAAYAEQQRQQMSQITDRLQLVERFQYEGRGKGLVADPQMADMIAEIKRLGVARDESSGRGTQQREGQAVTQWIISAAIAFAGLVAGVGFFLAGK